MPPCPRTPPEAAYFKVVLALILPSLVHLCSPAWVSAQYQFDAWNTDTGLPQNSVSAILQTRDGYLWLATNDGLVRYDGVRFTIFNKANTKGLRSNRITTLFESRDGSLWAGTEDGGLTRYADGTFTAFTTEHGLPDNYVWAIREDGSRILVLAKGKTAQWEGGRFSPYISEDGVSARDYNWWQRLAGLSFYDETGLHAFKDGRFRTFTTRDGLSSTDFAWLNEDQNRTLWAVTRDSRLHKLRDGALTVQALQGLDPGEIRTVHEDRQGAVWISTRPGRLHRLKDGALTTYGEGQGLSSKNILAIYEDREGTIWLGAANGLYRVREQAINVYSEPEGLSYPTAYTILEDREGNVWIGTMGGGLFKYKDGAFTQFTRKDGLSSFLVSALHEDRDGNLWIGTQSDGVNRFKDGRFTVFNPVDGVPDVGVLAIEDDREGNLWLGCHDGLRRYRDGAFTTYGTEDGLAHRTVQAIHEDRTGQLWLGTLGGLSLLKDGRFISYTERDGLSSNNIRSIYEDSDGTLWIGTYDGGLNRFKGGRFTKYTTTEGLYNNGVFQILEDARGNFWTSCNLGIYRVSKRDLNDFAEGKLKSIVSIPYGKKDGLLDLECNGGRQPAGWRTRGGSLWFPTQKGVAVIDPEAIGINTQPPPVVIEGFILGDEPVAFRDVLEVPPNKYGFEIRYTGLSFISPEQVRFKYRLVGLDHDWVDAGTRRAAYYSYLPPGEYVFDVIAANRDGVWNTEGASVRIRIHPPFWRTSWFLALAAAAFSGLVFSAYKHRVSKLKRAHAAQEAFSRRLIESQEAERKRIAAELHDSLGQNLLIIKNRALLGLNTPGDREKAIEQLHEISSAASQAIDEVREIAHNLRPYQLDRLGLTKAIAAIINKVSASSDIEFVTEIDPVDGVFSKESEINLYRVVQESVNNIVKHSGATRASLVIKKDARGVRIRIQDNGRGFSPAAPDGGHAGERGFGLTGISERARILGGKQFIRSEPGRGTTIILKIGLRDGQGAR